MTPVHLPKVLLVDHEPRVLEAIAPHLRSDYELHFALTGVEALNRLQATNGTAVVVADMRMPGMDGATLLKQVMVDYPQTARILLAGGSGRDTAVHPINQGQIFRLLTKPCPPARLKAAVEAGVDHFRLYNAEKAALQETLLGCVQALLDVLAIVNPRAFRRAKRIRQMAMDLAEALGWHNYWQLEAAAMLSQLGYISLPPALLEKHYSGQTLTPHERVLAEAAPQVATRLLENIPRLEPALQILMTQSTGGYWRMKGNGTIAFGARILAMVSEYDLLKAQGTGVNDAIEKLRRSGAYDEGMVAAFAERVGVCAPAHTIYEMPLKHVTVGMVFIQELRGPTGMLLVPQNFEVTEVFLQKMRTFSPTVLAGTVRMLACAEERIPKESRQWNRIGASKAN